MTKPSTAATLPRLPPKAIRLAHSLQAFFQAHGSCNHPWHHERRELIAFIVHNYDPESAVTGSATEPHNKPGYYPTSWVHEGSQVITAIAEVFDLALPHLPQSPGSRLGTKSLLNLPAELVLLIERELSDKEVYNLCRTNYCLYQLLSDSLCRRGMEDLRAFRWSLEGNKKEAFAKAVETLSPLPKTAPWNTVPLYNMINHMNVHLIKLMVSKGGLLQQQLEQLISSILTKSRRRNLSVPPFDKWDSVKNCLKWGADPNFVFPDGVSLMADAIMRSRYNPHKADRKVKLLLAHGADTGCLTSLPEKDSMMHLACLYYQPRIVQTLLEAGADPNLRDARNRTPIHRLFERDELKSRDRDHLLGILLADPRVRIDERDGDGRTPLSLAAGYSASLSLAMKFVKRVVFLPDKVDINSQDHQGKTPLCHAVSNTLCHAVSNNEWYMVRLFLAQHRLNPNLGPADAFPLFLAVDLGKQPILELLLDSKRLDVNKQTSKGETALWKAIRIGNGEAVELLARAGANPDIETSEGATARQILLDAGIHIRWQACST
jgi:ankyrin repeat protein